MALAWADAVGATPVSFPCTGSRAEQLGLGGGELLVGQRTRFVHLHEPAELVDLAAGRCRRGATYRGGGA